MSPRKGNTESKIVIQESDLKEIREIRDFLRSAGVISSLVQLHDAKNKVIERLDKLLQSLTEENRINSETF